LKLLTSEQNGLQKKVLSSTHCEGMVNMVGTIEISRVNIRDSLSVDLSVWMDDPDDWQFQPTLSVAGNTFSVSIKGNSAILAAIELDDEQLEAVQRDRTAELRIKFQVHGMHGRLKDIHPIIADGKAKKLATANWKTQQPVTFE
jgi:hypothetical protein